MLKPLLTLSFILLCYAGFCQQDTAKHATNLNCDVITLKNGNFIYCKNYKSSHHKIFYTNCNDTTGKELSVSTDSVFMINKQDGTVEERYQHAFNIDNRDTYIGLSTGLGNPIFQFNSPGPVDIKQPQTWEQANGLRDNALSGEVYDLYFQYHFPGEPAGLMTCFGYASNPFDVDSYSKVCYLSYSALPGSGVVPPDGNYTVTNEYTGNYRAYKLLVGASTGWYKKKISFSLYLALGPSLCQFPAVGYTCSSPDFWGPLGTTQSVSVAQSSAFGFSIQGGLCLRLLIFRRINILGGLNYYDCRVNFPSSIVTRGITGVTTTDYGMHIHYELINLTAGLAYSLGK